MNKKKTLTNNFGMMCIGSLMLFTLILMCILPHTRVVAADVTPTLGLSANVFCQSNTSDATNSNLQWNTSLGSQVDHYVVYRAMGNENFTQCYETTGLLYQEYNLEIGKTYSYQVKAVASNGSILATSNIATVTPCHISSNLQIHNNMTGGDLYHPTNGTKIGDTYYRYSMKNDSNGAYLVESTSKDGITFSNERVVADKSQNSGLASCKLESVQMKYIEQANKMIIWAHWELPSGYASGKALVITGTPGGNFTVHHIYNPLGIYVRDMAIFIDDDGTGYLAAASNEKGQAANATLYLFKMNSTYDDITQVVKKLHENQYREFPNLVKRDGYYYLFTSQAAGWYPSSGGYTVTKNLYGDWSELRSIGNTSTFSSQSGWVENVGSNGNCVLHAYRWLRSSDTAGSTLCPLYFANGYAFYDYCTSFRYSTTTGELYPVQEGELVSLNKPASSSINANTNSKGEATKAAQAFDGSYQTCFQASEKKWPFYLQVDLNGVYDLSNIQVSWFLHKGSEGYYTYYVEGSTDGKNWTKLLDRTNTSSERVNKNYGFTSDNLSGTARYVRLYVTNAHLHNNPNNNWYTPTVYEVKVFGHEVDGLSQSQSDRQPFAMYSFTNADSNGYITDSVNSSNKLKLYGNYHFTEAQVSSNTRQSVLYLDGSKGTYAALPHGLFDGKNNYTISLLAKTESKTNNNFFTLALGVDRTKYVLLKTATDSVRFNITTNSWQGESGIKSTTGTQDWCRYTVVVQDTTAYLYLDKQLMGIANLNNRLSDLGNNLTCYLGKSFYDEDGYFKGYIADIAFYNYALSSAQVANIGNIVITPDKEPETETPKEEEKPIENEKITLFSGEASADTWGQAVTLATTLQKGNFNPANITSGGNFYVEYAGTKDQVDFILQSFSGGPDWAKVTISESGYIDDHYYARYSFDHCVSAFGTNDFANKLDRIHVGAAGTYVKVYSLIYEPKNSFDSSEPDTDTSTDSGNNNTDSNTGDSDNSNTDEDSDDSSENLDTSGQSWDSLFWGESSAGNWEQPVSVYTTKNDGSFNSSNLKPGGHFYVEYSGTKDALDLVLQSWSGGATWAKVTKTGSGEANNHYYATYSYDSCVSAFGTNDFSNLLDAVHISATEEEITVYSVCYDYGK